MVLKKNTKPIEAVDPKTGQKGTSIPDGLEGGKTTEVKDVKYQGLTRQLRVQKEYSNGNGFKPELIINESARLSKPLQKAGFDIKTYGTTGTTIESTGVAKPKIVPVASTKLEIKIVSLLPGIH